MTKRVILSAAFLISVIISAAQTESFDIASFKPPVGWKRDVKPSVVNFTIRPTLLLFLMVEKL